MYRQKNINPKGHYVGDCVIRAIAEATGEPWEKVYVELAVQGFIMADMPSSNHVWGTYLASKGYEREIIPNTCPDCYSIADFADDHPQGVFIVATGTHVVAVRDGKYIDTWDSGDEVPVYYWRSKDE